MTEDAGPGRPDQTGSELGIHSLDHVCFAVPDLAAAEAFYRAFGLDVRRAGDALDLYTFGHPHRWGRLVEGRRKQLRHISFGAFPADLPGLWARLKASGVELAAAPKGQPDDTLWFHDPDGALIEVRPAEKSSPAEKSGFSNPSCAPGARGIGGRGSVAQVRPRRLAHALLFTRDVGRAIDFYGQTLGLRLSDRVGEGIAFLHGIHGSDHHLVAFAKSDGPGLHHSSWDVGSVQDVGLGAMQMAEAGHQAGWGLGRHVLGSNYFHYVQDPWGGYAEYSADIDYIPAGSRWPAANHAPEDAFYAWGPLPPQDFAVNRETQD